MTTARHHLPPLWVMGLGLVAVAANLRTVMASVPPLVQTIALDLGVSNAAMGALTTLPVLCMGVFAPVAQRLSARIGAAGAVEVAAACLALGTGLRLFGGYVWPLYAGTFLAGVGIAVGGTLLPGLVKELFPPHRSGLVTGLYMFAMMGGATASSALAVPLMQALGSWQGSLASWALLGIVGLAAWYPVARGAGRFRAASPPVDIDHRLPWRHATAWLIAAYLSIQSWQFYSSLAWLAPTYVAQGWNPTHAGYLLSVFSFAQVVSGLLGPALTDRVHDHRLLLLIAGFLGLVGQLGLWLAPAAAPWLWAVVLGLGQGAAFSLALVLVVDYGATPSGSGRLAGMAFFMSYTVASLGPTTMGALRDATGSFTAVWMSLALLMLVQLGLVWSLRPGLRQVA
ncbi:MAG TPA: MFS transporter [Pedococcus sp.]|nr:MFS transporter [Pedococcus sp.]